MSEENNMRPGNKKKDERERERGVRFQVADVASLCTHLCRAQLRQTWSDLLGEEGYSEMGRKGGETRKNQMGEEGYNKEGCSKGWRTGKDQIGEDGYSEMGRKEG
uniref:Uncharacterized protein n=1 Tax=Aegilops tauschii subsp. strangulata TaxID=200361 RepID=A0A453BT78_AEGTS